MNVLWVILVMLFFYIFFFQAEDGIRDGHVTGVQTCALPICPELRGTSRLRGDVGEAQLVDIISSEVPFNEVRSEERRVGKECITRGSPAHYKKKHQARSTA